MIALLRRTTFGRAIFAIGNRERASYLSGIRTSRVLLVAFVISGAAPWVSAGRDTIAAATQAQTLSAWPGQAWAKSLTVRQVLIEKRATFRCTPGLARPAARLATGLWGAGDFIEGPYPATLEGAVRSGLQAADGVIADA